MRKHRRIYDTYRFPGFRPVSIVRGSFGDPKARILRLERRGKKLCAAPAARFTGPRSEYHRLSGKDRAFVKGQRYNLLSRWENLSLTGRQALRKLLSANKRLQTAYLFKESFDQL